MTKTKTVFTNEDVNRFIESLESDQKKNDSYLLIQLMEAVTGEKARMWGPNHYRFWKLSL